MLQTQKFKVAAATRFENYFFYNREYNNVQCHLSARKKQFLTDFPRHFTLFSFPRWGINTAVASQIAVTIVFLSKRLLPFVLTWERRPTNEMSKTNYLKIVEIAKRKWGINLLLKAFLWGNEHFKPSLF